MEDFARDVDVVVVDVDVVMFNGPSSAIQITSCHRSDAGSTDILDKLEAILRQGNHSFLRTSIRRYTQHRRPSIGRSST